MANILDKLAALRVLCFFMKALLEKIDLLEIIVKTLKLSKIKSISYSYLKHIIYFNCVSAYETTPLLSIAKARPPL